jgi:hypothetical protein
LGKYTFFLLVVLFLSACSNRQSTAHDSAKLGGYVYGAIYQTQVDLFIGKTDWGHQKGSKFYLAPARSDNVSRRLHTAPSSIEQYYQSKDNYPDILGVIPAGSAIKLVEVIQHKGFSFFFGSRYTYFDYFAEVSFGEFASYKVEIADISLINELPNAEYFTRSPNPLYIRLKN